MYETRPIVQLLARLLAALAAPHQRVEHLDDRRVPPRGQLLQQHLHSVDGLQRVGAAAVADDEQPEQVVCELAHPVDRRPLAVPLAARVARPLHELGVLFEIAHPHKLDELDDVPEGGQ